MFGIGLGAAMTAFNESQKQRQEDEDRKRKLVLQQREDEEYNRAKKLRDSVDAIGIQTKKDFDAQVAAGKQKADQFSTFWKEQAIPKLQETYLAQGDYEAADRIQAWGERAEVKAGGKLTMSAMLKAMNGDYGGALDDALKAGQTKGYMDHGYELVDNTEIIDPKTNKLVGYRLDVKTPDGKTAQKDIAVADIPRTIGTLLNPEAAWKSYEAAQTQKAADARELKTYEEKKQIDKTYESSGDKLRVEAIKNLRKRYSGGLGGNEQKFDDFPADQKEKMIFEERGLLTGNGTNQASPGQAPGIPLGSGAVNPQSPAAVRPAAAPGLSSAAPAVAPKVIVDKVTGQRVSPASVPGLTSSTPPVSPSVQPQASGSSPAYSPPAAQASQQPGFSQEKVQYLVQAAQEAVSNGENPAAIAAKLRENGVPEDQWPSTLKAPAQ